MPTLYHHIYGFSMFSTLTKTLHEIVSIIQVSIIQVSIIQVSIIQVSIIQVIPSFFVFNKPLEIPSYILFSQCKAMILTWHRISNDLIYLTQLPQKMLLSPSERFHQNYFVA